MLTKYKITVAVTPNNILIFNQRFDQFVVTSGLTIAPIYSTASRNILSGVGFEPTPILVDQMALWLRVSGASLETWVWRFRPLGHPDSWQPLCLLSLCHFTFLIMVKNIFFKLEKYIRLELTQQSLLTSRVIAPSVVSRKESKWTYAGGSNE